MIPESRAGGAVLEVLGSGRAVGQHHRQPGRARPRPEPRRGRSTTGSARAPLRQLGTRSPSPPRSTAPSTATGSRRASASPTLAARRPRPASACRAGADEAHRGLAATPAATRRRRAWPHQGARAARGATGTRSRACARPRRATALPFSWAVARSSAWKSTIRCRRSASDAREDADGEQAGVAGVADRDRGDRDAGRHLHDREQRVHAVEVLERHRDADHRQRRDRGEHAGQVGRSAGAGDDHRAARGRRRPGRRRASRRASGARRRRRPRRRRRTPRAPRRRPSSPASRSRSPSRCRRGACAQLMLTRSRLPGRRANHAAACRARSRQSSRSSP